MTLEETLNDLLVKLFKDILEIEAKSLITEEFKDISYNDMHIIEAAGFFFAYFRRNETLSCPPRS